MKHALPLLLLTACHAPSLGDAITPDELTVGHGVGEHAGGIQAGHGGRDYSGESDTTYAALTWDIPTFADPEMTREERHAYREAVLAAEAEATEIEEAGTTTMKVTEGRREQWATGLFVVVGLLLIFVLLKLLKQRKDQWYD
tara:strand:- start:1882 stop:2307 length:426 start_codon:yes stop_codon:yes gene_type:complete